MSAKTMSFDHVKVGDELPALAIDVTATTIVGGALASRDFTPVHHDKTKAQAQGLPDVIMNTMTTNGFVSRFVTDWTGPTGRIGRMKFRMRDSVFPGDLMTFRATVTGTESDSHDCGWVDLDVSLWVDDRVCSSCEVRVAIPVDADDNPWMRRGSNWQPVG